MRTSALLCYANSSPATARSAGMLLSLIQLAPPVPHLRRFPR